MDTDFIIENGVLLEYKGTGTHAEIPDGVTSIRKNAFSGSENLVSVRIPDSVKKVGFQAFRGCTSLTDIVFGKGIEEISSGMFMKCTGLTSVVIPDNIRTIAMIAFRECTNLRSVTLPPTLERIGSDAFSECNELYEIKMPGGIPKIKFMDETSIIKVNQNARFFVRVYLFGDKTQNDDFDSACKEYILEKPFTYLFDALCVNSLVYAKKLLSVVGKVEEDKLIRLIDFATERNQEDFRELFLECKNKYY